MASRTEGALRPQPTSASRPPAASPAVVPHPGLSSAAFLDDLTERAWAPLALEGRLPEGLVGTLYRMGPTGFDWPQGSYRHWFDAHGMVHALRLGPDGVHHSNRLVQTEALARDRRTGRPGKSYGTLPQGLWARLKAPFEPFMGTANTNVIPWGDRLLALQEGGMLPNAMRLDTLESLGDEDFGYLGKDDSFSAHPRWDPLRQEAVAANLRYGRHAEVDVVTLSAHGKRTHAFTIRLPYAPALVHDMGLSARHAVVFAFPQVTRPLGLLLGVEELGFGSRWRPELGAFAWVAQRDGSGLRRHELPPMFAFHVVNAHDQGEDVVVDLVAFAHGDALQRVGAIRQRVPDLGDARLLRLTLRANGRTDCEALAEGFMEFPRTLPAWQGQAHPRAHFVGARPSRRPDEGLSGWFGAVLSLGASGDATWVAPEGWVLGEAVPVPKADGPEGAAWLLVLAYLPEAHRSRLLVLDAEDLAAGPVAEAPLPCHVPPGFHGQFRPA